MPGLVPGIQPYTCSGARFAVDPGNKCRDDMEPSVRVTALDDACGAERGDGFAVVAELREDRIGMLAECGGAAANRAGRAGEPHGRLGDGCRPRRSWELDRLE